MWSLIYGEHYTHYAHIANFTVFRINNENKYLAQTVPGFIIVLILTDDLQGVCIVWL